MDPPQTPAHSPIVLMPSAPVKAASKFKAGSVCTVKRSLTFKGTEKFIIEGILCSDLKYENQDSFEEAYAVLSAHVLAKGGSMKHATAAECAADYDDYVASISNFNYRRWEVGFSAGWPNAIGSGTNVIKRQMD